ncbi:MAG: Panacea domain-containing protein [Gemmatimonadales bacterium]
MNLTKLVKLIYLSDREALVRSGRPITMDMFCSLRYGPIVSNTLNLINEQPDPNEPRYWHQFVSERGADYNVSLQRDPVVDQLSRFEEEVIESIYKKFGHLNQWQLIDYTHTLPEWKDPGTSMLPIQLRDILIPAGYKEGEIEEIEAELDHVSQVDRVLL